MSFRGVFIAVFLGSALVIAGFAINARRPTRDLAQPTAALARAEGKCAECHRKETSAVVHEYEMSKHFTNKTKQVTCLDCHSPQKGQEGKEHKGFTIITKVTAANCSQCHAEQYQQYLESRHAAPAWAAVSGPKDFTVEQIAFSEKFNKGAVDRPENELVKREGPAAITKGCKQCHDVGRPNSDGTIGTCTKCHARHVASVELARLPETCGSCHMGPDHSQLEIYHESKHGVLFQSQRNRMNLEAPPKDLTTADMPVPTCATCHMSGLKSENQQAQFTHNVGERLGYYLFRDVSDERPQAESKRTAMKKLCLQCHTANPINTFYTEAKKVVVDTNKLVKEAKKIMDDLTKQGLLTPEPFDEPIEYVYFNLWHYGGRTAKHGAYMGGADFVQWHGYYEMVEKMAELKKMAAELRQKKSEKAEAKTEKTAVSIATPTASVEKPAANAVAVEPKVEKAETPVTKAESKPAGPEAAPAPTPAPAPAAGELPESVFAKPGDTDHASAR